MHVCVICIQLGVLGMNKEYILSKAVFLCIEGLFFHYVDIASVFKDLKMNFICRE